METHVRIVAWIHLIFGILGLCAAMIVFLFFGGIGAMVGEDSPARAEAPAILTIIGGAIGIIVAITALPAVAAGWGLLGFREWARILTIILSVFNLLAVPIGTVIGGYSLWVLLNQESQLLFRR